MDQTNNSADADRWKELCRAERELTAQICSHLHQIEDEMRCLRRALSSADERAVALRILLISQDADQKKALFPLLVDLASVAHSDISWCRNVIKSLPLGWVRANIMPSIAATLEKVADDPVDLEEAYRRFAELLEELEAGLLKAHVEKALHHSNEGVREVGADFSKPRKA